jgi:hypothetical protein
MLSLVKEDNMSYIRPALLMLLVGFVHAANAQSNEKQEKPRYAVIPPTDIMLTIASQPDCPLQLENVRLLYNLNTKRLNYQWDFRNRGTKPIVGFQVAAWFANGTGGTLTNDWEDKNEVLLPGQFIAETDITEKQIVPLTKELRDQLKLNGKMRMIIVLDVRYVDFLDGSQYKDLKTDSALTDFLEKYGDCIDRQEP